LSRRDRQGGEYAALRRLPRSAPYLSVRRLEKYLLENLRALLPSSKSAEI
jgi:hypothetical protein